MHTPKTHLSISACVINACHNTFVIEGRRQFSGPPKPDEIERNTYKEMNCCTLYTEGGNPLQRDFSIYFQKMCGILNVFRQQQQKEKQPTSLYLLQMRYIIDYVFSFMGHSRAYAITNCGNAYTHSATKRCTISGKV